MAAVGVTVVVVALATTVLSNGVGQRLCCQGRRGRGGRDVAGVYHRRRAPRRARARLAVQRVKRALLALADEVVQRRQRRWHDHGDRGCGGTALQGRGRNVQADGAAAAPPCGIAKLNRGAGGGSRALGRRGVRRDVQAGEVVLVLAPWDAKAREGEVTDEALDARIDALYSKGERAKRISELLSAWCGRPKRELYERVVSRKPR